MTLDAIGRQHSKPARRRGFTLLEALAATAILAIWYMVIMGSAIQGLRAEGVSRRRLEAASIADRAMAELEASILDGSVPATTSDIREEGLYTLEVTVAAFADTDDGSGAPTQETDPAITLESLLLGEIPARSADLRTLDVHVSWQEGGGERAVQRTSFAFDLNTAREAYAEAGLAETNPTPGTQPLEGEASTEEDGGGS